MFLGCPSVNASGRASCLHDVLQTSGLNFKLVDDAVQATDELVGF